MLSIQYGFSDVVSSGRWSVQYAVNIDCPNGLEWFYEDSGLISLSVDWGIFGDTVGVGCVQARQLMVTLQLPDGKEIPKRAQVSLLARLIDKRNNTGATQSFSWMSKGYFFISRRRSIGNKLELTCYDATLKLEGNYFSDGEDLGEWPRSMKTVAADIAKRVVIGGRVSIPSSLPDYEMEAPVGMTMREVMASIAAAYGGNWTIREAGQEFHLLPLGSVIGTYNTPIDAMSMAIIGDPVQITGVRMYYSDTDCFEAGNCNDGALECYCEWATQAMADNVYRAIAGKTLQAFSAANAWLPPHLEPGDEITINGLTYQIITMTGNLCAGGGIDVGFPGSEAEEDEYPYEGQVTKAMAKKVTLGKPYYGASISREQGLVVKRSDGQSEAVLNSDIFSMRAKDASGQMTDCIYFDTLTQRYRITGQVDIDGSLVTQNLYAKEGDIVSLTVDRLLTSQKVKKYLEHDTSPDNYISIQENRARWISAVVKTESIGETISYQTIQHKDIDGHLLYWAENPTEAQVVDGHYEIDGHRVTTTTTNTGWPVYVYDYEETQAMELTFSSDGTPAIIMGTGSIDRALIWKRSTGLQIDYINQDGKEMYIVFDQTGRIICKDTLSAVDISHLDEDETFTMTYGSQKVTYGLAKTDTGYRLTKPNGEGSVSIAT